MKLIIDVKLKRPGCALIQAMGDTDMSLFWMFDPATWLTAPTPDMKLIEGTEEEWRLFIEKCNRDIIG